MSAEATLPGRIESLWKVDGTVAAAVKINVVVVYHVAIVEIGDGLLKKFWLFGNRLHSTHCREFLYVKLCRPAFFVRTTQLLHHPGHE